MPESSLHTEHTLLQRAATGDQVAFTELFMQNRHKLFSFVMRLTESVQTTEDLIQDIFMKLWSNKSTLAAIDNFSSYLFKMAQNQCVSHFRRIAQETLILAQLEKEALPQQDSTHDKLSFKETQRQLQVAIDKLTPQQKIIFRLSREKGMKHQDIAAQLNLSASTVKNHMIDALRTIRQHFQSTDNSIVVGVFLSTILLSELQKIF